MHRTLVLDLPGLTPRLLKHASNLSALARDGAARPLRPVLPAVTCPVQASILTGSPPREHGAVANGWYFRDLAEIAFWRQSNNLIAGERLWETARRRDSGFTCAKLFWWFNMYSTADVSVTPRPIYMADGRKIPDIYTQPADLRQELTTRLGAFPLFRFWGPAADITSSRWIADCAQHIHATRRPTLNLVYLPHLDYPLQRLGPDDPRIGAEVAAVDALCGALIEQVQREGARVIVLSEYGITPVAGAVPINRILRQAGLLAVREELGRDKLDAGASEAFAVADHQVAHVYVRRRERVGEIRSLLEAVPGVAQVLDADGKQTCGLDHPRAGELVAISVPDRWFGYYYWLDDGRAPDFARTVDIHRKPGYDPVELFLDPALRMPRARIVWRLLQSRLGQRVLMDVIPLDPSLVRGSHGRLPTDAAEGPMIISSEPDLLPEGEVAATSVRDVILRHVFDGSGSRDVALQEAGEQEGGEAGKRAGR